LCSLLQSLVTASLLYPNILLSTLFTNTLNLYRDQCIAYIFRRFSYCITRAV
jgi:hypothetical protein